MRPKNGRPTIYTKELGEEICLAIATSSKGIEPLCEENDSWPCPQAIYEWRIKFKEFGDMFTQAKQHQIEVLVDQCLIIADDASHDTITKTDKSGYEYESCNSEWVNRSRLRIETRKWLAAKLAPRVWGEVKEDKNDKGNFLSTIRDEI